MRKKNYLESFLKHLFTRKMAFEGFTSKGDLDKIWPWRFMEGPVEDLGKVSYQKKPRWSYAIQNSYIRRRHLLNIPYKEDMWKISHLQDTGVCVFYFIYSLFFLRLRIRLLSVQDTRKDSFFPRSSSIHRRPEYGFLSTEHFYLVFLKE